MRAFFKKFICSPWLRPFNEPAAWHAIAKLLNRDYRPEGIGARVVRVVDESKDCKSFILQTNTGFLGQNWPSAYRAGQHCMVSLKINGRNLCRSFSISSAPGEPLQITVKANRNRQDRLSVSMWMLDNLHPGSELTLSPPAGQFVVTNQLLGSEYRPLTLISAGSGITPIRAMLRALSKQKQAFGIQQIHLIHLCRNEADFIFRSELLALANTWPALRVTTHFSAEQGRPTLLQLCKYIGENRAQSIYFCGPIPLQAELFDALDKAGYQGERLSEHFGGVVGMSGTDALFPLELEQDQIKRSFTVNKNQSLLQALEAAGAQIATGCRIGICNTCQCLKRTGTVLNLRTGELSDAPNELIRLCVSAPVSALSISLKG